MDPTLKGGQRLIYGTLERLLAMRGAHIIAVSRAEEEHSVLSLGIAASRVHTVVNGACLPRTATRSTARKAMQIGDNEIVVGFIGRLDEQKDPIRFVEAVTHAGQVVRQICGVIIGDGPLREEAEAAAGIANIRFLGWQDGPALCPGLDLFCMTSHYEAMPYTLLEALHSGVPIVTTAVGGAEETVQNGRNGIILPVTSSARQIGDALIALARDPEGREAHIKAAAALADMRTVDAMVAQTIDVYVRALTERSKGRRSK